MAITDDAGVLGGAPVISGTRIGVHHIVRHILHGEETVESVAAEVYPHLDECDVWDALEYHFEHPTRMQDVVRKRERAKREISDQAPRGPRDIPKEFRTD